MPDSITLALAERQVSVRLRRNARAKKYILRLPLESDSPVLTVPKGGTLATAQNFVQKQSGWIEERLASRTPRADLVPGSHVPFRGQRHLIESAGRLRGLVEIRHDGPNPVLVVPGEPQTVPRKLLKFFKDEARKDLECAVARHAGRVDRKVAAISIRDTRSRWGSCASNGRLSFSWRLVLAPPEILDYVAAHEVAHLVHMDHSERFWQVCFDLAPHTRQAQKWLKAHGAQLHAVG